MPQPTKGPRLGGSPAHQRLMLANLATSLFQHGKITTTEAKAKRLRPLAERLITFAKKGDLHSRRQVMAVVRDKDVVHTLFAEIGPRFAARPGGYTRIIKTNPRKGDNAPMAVIALVEGLTIAQEAVGEGERARGTRFQSRRARTRAAGGSTAVAEPVEEAGEVTTDAVDADETDAVDAVEADAVDAVEADAVEADAVEADAVEADAVEVSEVEDTDVVEDSAAETPEDEGTTKS